MAGHGWHDRAGNTGVAPDRSQPFPTVPTPLPTGPDREQPGNPQTNFGQTPDNPRAGSRQSPDNLPVISR